MGEGVGVGPKMSESTPGKKNSPKVGKRFIETYVITNSKKQNHLVLPPLNVNVFNHPVGTEHQYRAKKTAIKPRTSLPIASKLHSKL